MKKQLLLISLFLFSLLLILSSCQGGADPARAVEKYLQAKVKGDEQVIRSLLCAQKEGDAFLEINAFTSVSGAHIEGMHCQQVDDSDVVKCDGRIVAIYGSEETEFPLTSYRVVQEDGEWKWCGEAAE